MKTCDRCGKTKDTKDFCGQNCKRTYYRKGVPDKVHNKMVDVPREVQDNDNEDVPLQVQEDEYKIPTAPCAFCSRTLQYDDELEGFPCKKCRQITRLNTE